MPVTFEWLRERRIMIARFSGVLPMDDIRAWNEDTLPFLEQGVAPVHFIADLTELRAIPFRLVEVRTAVKHSRHLKLGWTVAVGGTSQVFNYARVITYVLLVRVHFTISIANALEFLALRDPTLQPNDDPP